MKNENENSKFVPNYHLSPFSTHITLTHSTLPTTPLFNKKAENKTSNKYTAIVEAVEKLGQGRNKVD